MSLKIEAGGGRTVTVGPAPPCVITGLAEIVSRIGRGEVGSWRRVCEVEAMMQIGEAAERVGLSLRTIRHWDEVGLVVPSARSNGGFRLYTEADIECLALVKTLKPLDFTLEQTRELLATTDAFAADCGTEAVTDDLLDRVASAIPPSSGGCGQT